MADADVPITAGAGTKIDTRTVGAGTDEHRQVIVVGDPTTAANVASVSAAGAQKVDGSAVTQPVSGTFWQATQPVSLVAVPTVTEKQDQPAASTGTWTSATGANTAVTVTATGYGTANVAITVPSTVTAGVISLEVSADGGTTYMPAGAVRVDNTLAENVISLQLTAGTANNRMYAVSTDAMTHVRARLSTVITGTGNVVVTVAVVAGGIEPLVSTIPPRTMFAATAQHTLVVAETLVSLTPVRGVTAAAAATNMVVTANRTLRITSITLAMQNATSAAIDPADVSLRARASGTVTTTDPQLFRTRIGNQTATLSTMGGPTQFVFPDGIDLPSGTAWGVSENAASVNGLLMVSVNGYEF